MRRRTGVAALAAAVILGVIASSAGAAGPVPGVLQGGNGIGVAGDARVVTRLHAGGLERTRMIVTKDGVLALSERGVGVLARTDTRTFEIEAVDDPR